MSADPESISSGRSFPQWLRTKTDNKYDFENQVVSPPAHDDSFFYIRYPINATNDKKQYSARGLHSITDAITTSTTEHISNNNNISNNRKSQKQSNESGTNMVQHTEPCKKFLNNKDRELTIDNVKHPPKPFGTDDGFKGAGAACGSSIVKVAKSLTRGFSVAKLSRDVEEVNAEQSSDELSFVKHQFAMRNHLNDDFAPPSHLMGRRGSKSLPASPLGSPKTIRRHNPNPFFTGTFAMASINPSNAASTMENAGRGWFLSSLLGSQATSSSNSVTHISEETEEQLDLTLPPLPSTSSPPQPQPKSQPQKVLKAKPSELREMNFWSPTSM